jgi:transposase InsO family protein
MPFMDSSLMDSRRRLVLEVQEGMSLSAACRLAGVTRKTGRKWVVRASETGIEKLCELSRVPKRVPERTDPVLEEALLALKARYPAWGARKLSECLRRDEGLVVPSRTADRILARNGQTRPAHARLAEPIRFERETSGALLQMDFKGLPKSAPYALLSVLDDHARFCLMFAPVKDKTGQSVQEALWEMFAEHGLPYSMLMDRGDCWGCVQSKSPTKFEAWLMRLGIKPIHGRASHPQTQGKVERFHLTAKTEMGLNLVQGCAKDVEAHCKEFVDRYNWVRPHDSLGGKVPGSAYAAFDKKRPNKPPLHEIAPGEITRKVDVTGHITYKGKLTTIGKGLIGERIVIRDAQLGQRVFYAGFALGYMSEYQS